MVAFSDILNLSKKPGKRFESVWAWNEEWNGV